MNKYQLIEYGQKLSGIADLDELSEQYKLWREKVLLNYYHNDVAFVFIRHAVRAAGWWQACGPRGNAVRAVQGERAAGFPPFFRRGISSWGR